MIYDKHREKLETKEQYLLLLLTKHQDFLLNLPVGNIQLLYEDFKYL